MKKVFKALGLGGFGEKGEKKHWQRMISLWYFVLLTCVFSFKVYANDKNIYLNIGGRISYAFGKNGGFGGGFEISFTQFDFKSPIWGVLASFDSRKSLNKIHFGFEVVGPYTIGISIGPTLTKDKNVIDYGFTTTVFAGVIIYPFYAYTWRANSSSISEAGTFLKFPILIHRGIESRLVH